MMRGLRTTAASPARRAMLATVLGVIMLCAIALGTLGFCPVDPFFAGATALVALFWAWRLTRTPRYPKTVTEPPQRRLEQDGALRG